MNNTNVHFTSIEEMEQDNKQIKQTSFIADSIEHRLK